MKKIKMSLLALVSFVFSGISFSQAPTADRNVMNFSDVASYEPYADDESTWRSLRSIAEESRTLTTLAEQEGSSEKDVDTLYPEFLKEVLNTDYIFQIGDYLIKIDLVNDRGLMIASGHTDAYSSLVKNNLSASGMMVLDGDEDFGLELLEALENNETTPKEYQSFLSAERSCRGARRETLKAIPEWANTNEQCDIGGSYTIGKTYGMDNKLVYQKAIVYFSLQSKIRSIYRCTYGGSWTFAPIYKFVDLKLEGFVKYRKRCEKEVNKDADLYAEYFGEGHNGTLNWRPYGGGRSLSHYDFTVQFGIRVATDRNPNPPPYVLSPRYNIKWGY